MNLGRRDILKAIAGSVAATFLGGIQLGEEDRERHRLRELADRVGDVAGDLYMRVGGTWERLRPAQAVGWVFAPVAKGSGAVWVDAEETR